MSMKIRKKHREKENMNNNYELIDTTKNKVEKTE